MSAIVENPVELVAEEPMAPARAKRSGPKPADSGTVSEKLRQWGTSYDACGFYWSALIHVIVMCLILLVLWWLDLFYLGETFQQTTPIRAALADEEIEDLNPLLELAEIEIEPAAGVEPLNETISTLATLSDIAPQVATDITSLAGLNDGMTGEGEGAEFLHKATEAGNAVTKGSFTAWTVPENPDPDQNYMIVVQVKLPERIRQLKAADLSGIVVGTDDYEQRIPFDRRAPGMTFTTRRKKAVILKLSDFLPINKGKAQLMVWVPGAARLVRDRITIRSRILKEEQTLEIVFGQKEDEDGGDLD